MARYCRLRVTVMMATGTKAITPSRKSLHRSDVLGSCGSNEGGGEPTNCRGRARRAERRHHDGERVVLHYGGWLGLVEAPRADEEFWDPCLSLVILPHVEGMAPRLSDFSRPSPGRAGRAGTASTSAATTAAAAMSDYDDAIRPRGSPAGVRVASAEAADSTKTASRLTQVMAPSKCPKWV